MKKLIFTMLIALFSILSFNEAKATCPSGWSSTIDTLTIDGCDYMIELCLQCNISYPSNILLRSITPLDSNCDLENKDVLISMIYSIIYEPNYVSALCFYPGPCGSPTERTWTMRKDFCWKVYKNDKENNKYMICDDNCYCTKTVVICWNNLTQSFFYNTIQININCPGYNNPYEKCPYNYNDLPYFAPGAYSDCFKVNIDCE
jgi:hypothetical protein